MVLVDLVDIYMSVAPPPPFTTPPMLSTLVIPSQALEPLHATKTSDQHYTMPEKIALVPPHGMLMSLDFY